MGKKFIECRHPSLPVDQTALMVYPRNGWVPVDQGQEANQDPPRALAAKKAAAKKARKKTSPQSAGTDSPTAGQSNTTGMRSE